jgi:hypothetical protein
MVNCVKFDMDILGLNYLCISSYIIIIIRNSEKIVDWHKLSRRFYQVSACCYENPFQLQMN